VTDETGTNESRLPAETRTDPGTTATAGNPGMAGETGAGASAADGHRARPRVHGAVVDAATRCVHYNGPTDIIAIKFRCCDRFYPCFSCHADAEPHPARRWAPAEWTERAILCGACGHTLSIAEYRGVSGCPACGSAFNDGCRLHAHLYFEVAEQQG
jgi:uncharacterized CHY-type Zn-finger protein